MKFIAVSAKTLYEWKKTIDIFYKMGYCWNDVYNFTIKTKKYFESFFNKYQEANVLIVNYFEDDNSIIHGYDTNNLHNCYTFSQFNNKFGIKEELE